MSPGGGEQRQDCPGQDEEEFVIFVGKENEDKVS